MGFFILRRGRKANDRTSLDTLVDGIIDVESKGDANAKNRKSSATGLGQFPDETWLDMIRVYRPELARGRSEDEILDYVEMPNFPASSQHGLRERNAAILKRRGLPVTAGTVYLAHFAGVRALLHSSPRQRTQMLRWL
jgi:hypothetical protein